MTFKERAHDLFIPIRRKQRPSSGDAASTTSTSFPESPRTPTRRTSGFADDETRTKTATVLPFSGGRSTAATTRNYAAVNFIPKSSSPLRSETSEQGNQTPIVPQASSTRQDARHGRTASSPMPRAPPQVSPPKSMRQPTQAHPRFVPIDLELQIAEEQIARTSMPTPFPSPDAPTNMMSLSSYLQRQDPPPNLGATEQTRSGRTLSVLKNSPLDSSVLRPQSRDSSRSSKTRSHPPSSFPATLLEHGPDAAPVPVSPKRSIQIGAKAESPNRSAKRYTILGIPSAAVTTAPRESPPRRRNSVGQAGDNLSRSDHAARVADYVHPRGVERGSFGPASQTANLHLHSSSRPSSRHSRSSSQNPAVNDFSFHTTVHYYTACTHTSPPKSRPLNEQPYLEPDLPDVDAQQRPRRNFIRGSCFDCDTAARRGNETQILLRFSPEISRLMSDLTHLVSTLEDSVSYPKHTGSPPRTPVNGGLTFYDNFSPGKSSVMTKGTNESISTGKTAATNVFTDSTSITTDSSHDGPEAIERQISHLQQVITQLSKQRDIEVNKIWAGYSTRWGPGTLGVVQTKKPGSMSSRSASQAGSRSRPASIIETPHTGAHDTFYYDSEEASQVTSAHHSPQKPTLLDDVSDDQYSLAGNRFRARNSLHILPSQVPVTPTVQRSKSVKTGADTSARSFYSSFSHHRRERSRDTTPNTPFGAQSIARTETGISYSNSDTPVGRMKVNWVRGMDPT